MCDGKPYVAGLDQFAERVLNNLWNAVVKFYPAEVSEPVKTYLAFLFVLNSLLVFFY